MKLQVLLIEDDADDAELALRELRHAGYEPVGERVENADSLGSALERQSWDVIISDHSMPAFTSTAALAGVRQRDGDVPFIILSGAIGEEEAVAAMRSGAQDYILKSNRKRLGPAVERELREVAVRRARHEAEARQREAEETIRHLAFHDRLTDLPNRLSFETHLQELIDAGRQATRPIAVLFVHLDRFEEIKNTLGARNGDLVLAAVALRLREAFTATNQVACIGGPAFAIVLPDTDVREAQRAATDVLESLGKPVPIEDLPIEVDPTVGISVFPGNGENPDLLLRCAEVAMSAARHAGDGWAMYSPERDPYSTRRLRLMGELRAAMAAGHLSVHFQPKVGMRSARVEGLEALVRWNHPTLGMIRPDEFIAPAEQSGLIQPLTQWVLNQVLRQCRAWRQAGISIPIAVNLSARNLIDTQLTERIWGLLQTWGAQPDWVQFEVTESGVMADPALATAMLERLNARGIRLAIDDFGTGYSSLAYLRKLPVSEIKIDRSFIMGLGSNPQGVAVVKAVIEMAHALELEVVAEGIEDRGTWDMLLSLGCDTGQGYYMGRPMAASELEQWLIKSPWALSDRPAAALPSTTQRSSITPKPAEIMTSSDVEAPQSSAQATTPKTIR